MRRPPSFASLVKCLEVILKAAVYSFPVGLEKDPDIYIGHADLEEPLSCRYRAAGSQTSGAGGSALVT